MPRPLCTSCGHVLDYASPDTFWTTTGAEVGARYGVAQTTVSSWVTAKTRADAELKPRHRALKPCGTHAAYARHRRNGEPACDACRIAEAAYFQERTQRRERAS